MSKSIEKFEDLIVWKDSMRLVIDIYKNLRECKDFGLRDQMQRASVSIPSNISEGFDRNSNKEYIHFLFIARGSCAELRTQLYLTKELKIIKNSQVEVLIDKTKKISAMLYKLIQTRKERF
ncbi:MAG: four helix bundle protein [Candidatus Cloacimonetes bacterium]|nr:four helix bundle protein [Candidatus Cloacimonadota bacterium]